ncbi:hypothetical protein BLNAU_14501 [Blattamonas nauphoetae]|uniref:Uncharacterized protein n=1 Tax=Blattamonas nauphoetae TaxID=2049346 RepID=A0ABQ9XGR9_9EUKA|nr:hypothetical protein BLNAU_14501 [Blattamonas nauphoetae]
MSSTSSDTSYLNSVGFSLPSSKTSENSTQTHPPSNPEPKTVNSQPSSSPPSILPLLTSHYLQDLDASLSPQEPRRTLTKLSDHVGEAIETGKEISWTTVLKWFVEGVIGLDSRLKHRPCQFPLTADDVLIDDTGTIRINPSQLSPPSSPSAIVPSFSSDLVTFVNLFITVLEKLHVSFLLLTPDLELDLDRTSNAVTSLLNSFIQSKDINTNDVDEIPLSSSTTAVLEPTAMAVQINTPFKQTPVDESIASIGVGSGFESLHPSTQRSVQSDDSQSTSVNSDQSTSASITLQTEPPPSEDTDPLFLDSASIITHSLSARLHSAAESNEAVAIVELLQTLIPPPLIPHTVANPSLPLEAFNLEHFELDENFDVTERFSVSIFDEDDDSILKSLNRCRSVCDCVPPDQCIDDIPAFVELLITALTSNRSDITILASIVLSKLLYETLDFIGFLQQYWDYIKTAFQDGSIGARIILVLVIRMWFNNHQDVHSTNPPLNLNNTLDEIVSADTGSIPLFLVVIAFLTFLKTCPSGTLPHRYINSLFRSFETNQHASERIGLLILEGVFDFNVELKSAVITFCLILSLHIGLPLQPDLFDYILNYPNLHSTLVETNTPPNLLLSHTAINHHAQKQRAFLMQLLFENTLCSDPSTFFIVDDSQDFDLLFENVLTPLVGLHSLFVRGLHIKENDTSHLSSMTMIVQVTNESDMFLTNQFRLYAYVPPPQVLQFFFKSLLQIPPFTLDETTIHGFLFHFLATCGPFGECRTLFSLLKYFLSSLPINNYESNKNKVITRLSAVIGLHWFSLPPSFNSPFHVLRHPLLRLPEITLIMKPWLLQSIWKTQLPLLFSATAPMENDIILHVFELASTLGVFFRIITSISASVFSHCGLTKRLCSLLISPVPSVVSLVLVFLARLIHLSDDEGKMEMVLLGVIDYVVVAVSQSSFLEDYENGIALIGDLLETVRQDEQKRRMTIFDFSFIL